jgi:hypothetical protein
VIKQIGRAVVGLRGGGVVALSPQRYPHAMSTRAKPRSSPERQPWLAIDPKPLAGDPGFELLPALDNRWEEVVATGNMTRAVLRRFDLLTEVLGLDRQRAIGWTLGRVLQNALWDIEDGDTALDPTQIAIAAALIRRAPYPDCPHDGSHAESDA